MNHFYCAACALKIQCARKIVIEVHEDYIPVIQGTVCVGFDKEGYVLEFLAAEINTFKGE